MAKIAIRVGHCEKEDHHPEYHAKGKGEVDIIKLFVDRLSVHLQKDKRENKGGWDVDPVYIPAQYLEHFEKFCPGWNHIDTYENAYKPGLADPMWPDEYDYAKTGKELSYSAPISDPKTE